MIHCVCLAHGLMRVAEFVRSSYVLTDKFVNNMKKMLVKCGRRKREYVEETSLTLPPNVSCTRWSSWLNACFYFAVNLDKIKTFVLNLDPESRAIADLQDIFMNNIAILSTELAFILNFRFYFTDFLIKLILYFTPSPNFI